MNPRLKNTTTGEIEKKYNRGYAEPATVGQIMDMLFGGVGNLKAIVEAIRDGQEELKDTLPFLCPHYAEFRNNHRAQADIIPEAFTFRTCVDVDDKALVEAAKERALEVNKNPFSEFEGLVEYIEYSARKKLHIWIRIPKGMTIAEAQQAFCQEIEVPYDESCITPERFIYMTGDEVYRSERWLQPLTDEDIAERREAFLQRVAVLLQGLADHLRGHLRLQVLVELDLLVLLCDEDRRPVFFRLQIMLYAVLFLLDLVYGFQNCKVLLILRDTQLSLQLTGILFCLPELLLQVLELLLMGRGDLLPKLCLICIHLKLMLFLHEHFQLTDPRV